MKKYLSCIALVFIFPLVFTNVAWAANISVYLNGQAQTYNPAPIIQKGTTIVPMRAIFEQLGANIDWDPKTMTVTATKDNTLISLTIGQQVAYINGKQVTLAIPSQTINGRTMVPLRFVSESLGAMVRWEAKTWSIYIDNAPTNTQPQNQVSQTTLTVEEIAKNSSSVVLIKTFDGRGQALGLGSGFVIKESGIIATNYHVINGASSATVNFENGASFKVSYIKGYDIDRDVAALQIDASGLKALPLADSTNNVLGEKVVAIGNPLGLQNTISDGIISSLNRSVDGNNFIQTSAPISHGSSGGPLFNMEGEVIGINSAGFSDGQNLNLAIPISEAKSVFNKNLTVTLTNLNSTSAYSGGSAGKMTDDQFANYIFSNYGSRTVGNYTIRPSEVKTFILESDGTICFNLMFDEYGFSDFAGALEDGYDSDLEDWLYDCSKEAAANYPEENVMVSFMFQDSFDEYPSPPFSAENISYSDGSWLVTWIPVYDLVDSGQITFGDWSNP